MSILSKSEDFLFLRQWSRRHGPTRTNIQRKLRSQTCTNMWKDDGRERGGKVSEESISKGRISGHYRQEKIKNKTWVMSRIFFTWRILNDLSYGRKPTLAKTEVGSTLDYVGHNLIRFAYVELRAIFFLAQQILNPNILYFCQQILRIETHSSNVD